LKAGVTCESDHDNRHTSEHDNRWSVLAGTSGVNTGGLFSVRFPDVLVCRWDGNRDAISIDVNPSFWWRGRKPGRD
jgi:hypothetical protein